MTDFPSDFERETRRHERAVDDRRHREELEAEVVRLGANEELHRRAIDAGANYVKELEAEVERLRAELAWYRGRAERAEYIVVGLASTLSRYSGFDPGPLIQAHAPENAGPPSTTTGG
jgi:hypothetical protein